MLLVFVEVVMRAPGPDTDPQWQLDERWRALERLASVVGAIATHVRMGETDRLAVLIVLLGLTLFVAVERFGPHSL